MTEWEELNRRLDLTRIYLVGSNEWTEMMVAMYEAVEACLSISAYDNAEAIIALMEKEIEAADENMPEMYEERIEHRLKTYKPGMDFDDGENQTEPRPVP